MTASEERRAPAPPVSRRDETRTRTLAEIKERALGQVVAGGPDAVSLNAIARDMRMSGPALYRYFPSRDALLAVLVEESYDHLADSLTVAAQEAAQRPGAERFRAVATAYRTWALDHPHRYRLTFMSTSGSGSLEPKRIVRAANRSMTTFLEALAGSHVGTGSVAPALADELYAWNESRTSRDDRHEGRYTSEDLQRGVLAWTRLHGVLSLELQGAFAMMDLDAALLYDQELSSLTV